MTKEEILNDLQPIFQDVFDDEDIVITNESNAAQIEDWDSLSHIRLVVAIEKQFDVKFAFGELQDLKNVGEMIDLITRMSSCSCFSRLPLEDISSSAAGRKTRNGQMSGWSDLVCSFIPIGILRICRCFC